MLKLNLQFHAMPGGTTPLRADTFKKLQLNAGIFIKNLTIGNDAAAMATAIAAAITAGTNLLGATRGGGTFTVTKETRKPDVDGRRYPFKGDTVVDSVDGYLSTTLVEITPENFALGLGSATIEGSGTKKTITMNTAIRDTDYIDTLVWVGDLADGQFVAIELLNALNTADLSFAFTDKGEGTIPIEMHAHQADVSAYDTAPFRVHFLNKASTPGG